jgi:hypothetical protein
MTWSRDMRKKTWNLTRTDGGLEPGRPLSHDEMVAAVHAIMRGDEPDFGRPAEDERAAA